MKMGEKPKILVIDDSAETVAGLYSFFDNKYEVLTAANGLDGLTHIEENDTDIDLVITDLVMPDISGVGVISIVKKKYPDIPVIAITGWGEHPEALATEADADLVLEKPFELSDLDKSVSDLLAKKKKK
jgi:DNA-binding NtrC family response regulator